MCSTDIFLGVLAILFPPLPGEFAPRAHHPIPPQLTHSLQSG